MIILEESKEMQDLQEVFINVLPSLPENVENSIYYAKLKNLLHGEIISFLREKIDLKHDLNILRMNIGEQLTETTIREYLDGLKEEYNSKDDNLAIDYHIEITRYDYGVPVFVIVKRDQIYMKKFVFRFKKKLVSGVSNLTNAGVFRNNTTGKKE